MLLQPGLYEQVINEEMGDELDVLPPQRRATAAIDKAAIVQVALNGDGTPVDAMVPDCFPGTTAENAPTYDPEQAAYFAQLVTAVLRGSRPRSAQRVAQIHSMMGLVQAGRGVAIVPESISSLTGDEVVFRPISGWDAAVVELRIAWRRDLAHPAARRALDVLDALSEASARP